MMGTARESMLFMWWKEPVMRSYREAFDGVVARFPDAHVSTVGHETDTMFIIPPGDPNAEGSPIYFVPKDGSEILKFGSGSWKKIDALFDDPSRRPASIES